MCVVGYSEQGLVKCLWWRELKTVTQEFNEAHLIAVSNLAGVGDEIARRARNFVDTVRKSDGKAKDGKE
jgi:hypothetical protein